MVWKGHALLGAAAATSSAAAFSMPISTGIMYIPIVILCSLWPDLDGEGARLSKLLPPITTLLSWVTRKLAKVIYILTKTSSDVDKPRIHRGLSHTPLYIFVCGALLWVAVAFTALDPGVFAGGFVVGNLAHLLGDAFSLSGLPLLWPLKRGGKRWVDIKVPRRVRFRVGAEVETVILTPIMFVLAVLGTVWYLYTIVH